MGGDEEVVMAAPPAETVDSPVAADKNSGGSKKSKKSKKSKRSRQEEEVVDEKNLPVGLRATERPQGSDDDQAELEKAPEQKKMTKEEEEEEKAKRRAEAAKKAAETREKNGQVNIEGQTVNGVSESDAQQAAFEQQDLDMSVMEFNSRCRVMLKLLKQSPRWQKKFINVEVNDDPIKMWLKPIVRVTPLLRIEQVERCLTRMMNTQIRCMTMDPANEPKIREYRDKFENLWFKLRRATELETEYEPVYQHTMQGLVKTQNRLDQLQAGMGYSASEPSVSSDCREEAMDKLKNTRKQMQYTIANIATQ